MRSEVSDSRAAHRAIISPGEQLITREKGGGGGYTMLGTL